MIYWIYLIFLGTLGWGVSLFLIKILLVSLTPIEIVLYRMIIGSLVLFVLIFLLQMKVNNKIILLRDGLMVALFNIVIPFYLTSYAETAIASSLASVINGLTPIFTFLMCVLLMPSECNMRYVHFMSVLLGLVGMLMVNMGFSTDVNSLTCLFALVIASISYAIAANYVKLYAESKDPILLSTMAAFLSALIMLVSQGLTAKTWHMPQTMQQLFALLWLGGVGSGVSLYLYCLLIQRRGAVTASMVTYLMLVTGVMVGALFLHESISMSAGWGCVCIIVSLILMNHSNKFKRK